MIFGRQQTTRGARWIESLVITVSAPVLGSLVSPDDPYLLKAPFPWLLLAPLAVGLQHGLWAGLFSSALLCTGALFQSLTVGAIPADFTSWCIGCGLVALVAGQVRDSVRARSEQLILRTEELQDRLERSERTRHVIQLSHAKLAERVASGRSSLVAAIEGAAQRMGEARSMQELGQVLLEVVANQGSLHAASLYIAGRDIEQLVPTPVANFGGNGESSAHNALVVRAFTTGKLAAIVDGPEAVLDDKSVLAAVPLITSRRQIVGVIAVHQLPFMAFHAEHLNQLFVLAGHLSDMLFDRWVEVHAEPRQLPEISTVVPTLRAAKLAQHAPALTSTTLDTPRVEDEVLIAPQITVEGEPSIDVELPADEDEAEAAPKAPAIRMPAPRSRKITATGLPVARIAIVEVAVAAPAVVEASPATEVIEATAAAADARREEEAIASSVEQQPVEEPTDASAASDADITASAPEAVAAEDADSGVNPLLRALRRAKRIDAPVTKRREKSAPPVAAESARVEAPRAHRHVTREFPALLKFPKPMQTAPVAPAAANRPRMRAQAEIRAQVAEAAARRSSSL